jgi:ABC-2 type transport system permease protein
MSTLKEPPKSTISVLRPLPIRRKRLGWVDWEGIAMVWERDLVRFIQQRTRLFGGVVRSVVWLFALGLGLRSSFVPVGGLDYTQFIFPGIIAMSVIFSALQSSISIIWDREFGLLKEELVAPVPRSTIVLGKALGGGTTSTLQGLIILPLAPLAGVRPSAEGLLLALLFIYLTSLSMSGLGILIAARMHDFEGFGVIQNFVAMPMFLLSGAMFPVANVPGWLSWIIHLNPLSYGVDATRGALSGYHTYSYLLDVLALLTFASVALGISIRLFEREG